MLIQRAIWIVVRPLVWLFVDIKFATPNGKFPAVQRPFIIVSNHKHMLDPFVVCTSFPFWGKVWPVRFMAEDKRFKNKILNFLLKIRLMQLAYKVLGAFPSHRGEGIDKAIELPLRFLAQGQSVLIFPEGRVQRRDELGEFKHGASAMALESGLPIVPVSLKRPGAGRIKMKIGEPFLLSGISREEGTKIIKEKILELL